MRAAIYARVSVKHQNRKDLSIEAQVAVCREYLKRENVLFEAEVFSDLGYSGRRFDRPAFLRLKAQVERHQVDCVVVKDLSRLGRDYRRVGDLVERFFPLYGVRLLSVSERYNSADIMGNSAAAGLYHLLNEWYAKDIGRKVALVKGEKKRAGNYMGSVPPYGYKIVKREGRRVLEPDQSYPVLAIIHDLHEEGHSSEEIVQLLWRKGVNPPSVYRKSGRVVEKDGQAPRWSSGTIRNLLSHSMEWPE